MKETENYNDTNNNKSLNTSIASSKENPRKVNIDEETKVLLEKKTENLENIFNHGYKKINSLRKKKKNIYMIKNILRNQMSQKIYQMNLNFLMKIRKI